VAGESLHLHRQGLIRLWEGPVGRFNLYDRLIASGMLVANCLVSECRPTLEPGNSASVEKCLDRLDSYLREEKQPAAGMPNLGRTKQNFQFQLRTKHRIVVGWAHRNFSLQASWLFQALWASFRRLWSYIYGAIKFHELRVDGGIRSAGRLLCCIPKLTTCSGCSMSKTECRNLFDFSS